MRLNWPSTDPAAADRASPATDDDQDPPGPDRHQDPRPESSPRIGNAGTAPPHATQVFEAEVVGSAALRRAVIDSQDRFADSVLQRLRALQGDVDADLAELRSEVSQMRQAIMDLADLAELRSEVSQMRQAIMDLAERVELRQVRATVDDLRSDVAGLRRAVLEWPELERVSGDITAIRADLSDLLGRRPEDRPHASVSSGQQRVELTPVLDDLAALREEVAAVASTPPSVPLTLAGLTPVLEELTALRTEVASLNSSVAERVTPPAEVAATAATEAVRDELAGVRADLNALRRRVALRVGSAEGSGLSDEQVDALADRIVGRLVAELDLGEIS